MSYQLRHRQFGVFQGECMGMGFWYDDANPTAEMMPEQGYYEFSDHESVVAFRAFLTSSGCEAPLKFSDLTIEPYDRVESERLQREVPA